ncbi:MAG: carbohydrate ABC transporter permease [Anaerolineae bacterium]|nr:carbohydrate ABC transporter permease [Anaerolineae bacterium]
MAVEMISKPAASASASSLSKFTRPLNVIFTYTVIILFALAMLLPFIYALANSLKAPQDIAANPQSLLADPATGYPATGYQRVFQRDFPRWTLNSFIFAAAVTIGNVFFCSMAGYALSRIKFPGRSLAFAALVGTLMVPGIVLLIPRFLILKQIGLVDTYGGLIIPVLAGAFGVFLMRQFFESIPADIEEAAAIDGASRIRMFFVVILPIAIPALTALAIFSFQGAWNDFTGPLVSVGSNKELWTLPLGLAFLRGSTGQALEWDLLLAGAVITTLPMAIIFFIFQRFFMESATYTAVKG